MKIQVLVAITMVFVAVAAATATNVVDYKNVNVQQKAALQMVEDNCDSQDHEDLEDCDRALKFLNEFPKYNADPLVKKYSNIRALEE